MLRLCNVLDTATHCRRNSQLQRLCISGGPNKGPSLLDAAIWRASAQKSILDVMRLRGWWLGAVMACAVFVMRRARDEFVCARLRREATHSRGKLSKDRYRFVLSAHFASSARSSVLRPVSRGRRTTRKLREQHFRRQVNRCTSCAKWRIRRAIADNHFYWTAQGRRLFIGAVRS